MGGYLSYTSNHFEEAPDYCYYYSYQNKEKAGNSKVLSIPLGMTDSCRLWKGLIPEANDIESQKKLVDTMSQKYSIKGNTVNLLIHSYNFYKNFKRITEVIGYIKTLNNVKIINYEELINNS